MSLTGHRFKIIGIGIAVFSLMGSWQNARADGEGTAGAMFLKIGTSARAEAMGGAYTAVVNDVDACYWNPAGLTRLQRSTVGLTHLEWFEDIRYEYLSYADKYANVGAVGMSVGYLYLGDIPKTFEMASGDYDTLSSGGTFGASDMSLSFAWAGKLGWKEHKVGVGIKIIQESIDDSQSFSVGLDLGNQYLISRTRWYRALAPEKWSTRLIPHVIGISVKNLGTAVKFFNQNDPLPLSTALGLGYQFLDDDLVTALDFTYQAVENILTLHAGAEYWIHTGIRGGPDRMLDLALRAGYRTGYDPTAAPGFSVGGGIKYAALGLDYVFMPFGDLGVTHRVSLKFSWGEILKERTLPKRKQVVKRELKPSEKALRDTAKRMVKSRKSMEGKVVVRKSPEAKREMTTVEAKKPGAQDVAQETKTLGADIKEKSKDKRRRKSKAAKIIAKGRGSKLSQKELLAKITGLKKSQSTPGRSQTKYQRRTKDDAERAARREAKRQTLAFDEVEAAAKEEAKKRGFKDAPGKLVTKTTVYFSKQNSRLISKYLYALNKIALSYDSYPKRTILVHGYTSSDEKKKRDLSLKRAKAVREYLVQVKSIPSNKISLRGFGDKDPAKSNDSARGRASNRRVRVQLIKSGN